MAEEKTKPEKKTTKALDPKAAGKEAEKKAENVEVKEGEKPEEKKAVKRSRKVRAVPEGNIHIQASFNNTIVTFTDTKGDVVAWSSAGSSGFRGARKATPYAAQVAAENAVSKAQVYGFSKANVYIKGIGAGREQSVRALIAAGIDLLSINDITPMPHNGCRRKKERRV